MATTCATILPFPSGDAGIRTPRPAATLRRPVTTNSRPRMIITIQAGTASSSTSDEEGGGRQELVRQRVEQDAQARHLVAAAGRSSRPGSR